MMQTYSIVFSLALLLVGTTSADPAIIHSTTVLRAHSHVKDHAPKLKPNNGNRMMNHEARELGSKGDKKKNDGSKKNDKSADDNKEKDKKKKGKKNKRDKKNNDEPSASLTALPSGAPSQLPTTSPTVNTNVPTTAPTISPVPTALQTAVPTVEPTFAPSHIPTAEPIVVPTLTPTAAPSYVPTATTAEPPTSSNIQVEDWNTNNAGPNLTVNAGETVEWTWTTGNHNVWSMNSNDCSDTITEVGDTSGTTVTFDTAGTYWFSCQVGNHCSQGMLMSVTVE